MSEKEEYVKIPRKVLQEIVEQLREIEKKLRKPSF